MQRPILPKGISDFGKLVRYRDSKGNPFLFVDKTLLIKDFIDGGDEVTLITRPRRFGKTINLSMLECFFNKEVGGRPTKDLFEGLKVSKYPNIMAYQGQTPAIFITLKGIRGENYELAYDRFKKHIRRLYKKHEYLLGTKIMSATKIKFFINPFYQAMHLKLHMNHLCIFYLIYCTIFMVKKSIYLCR